MLLLSFAVTNHKSIRDRAELSFLKAELKTLRPNQPEIWHEYVEPVAAILGANASGKSNILDALQFAKAAILMSARGWLERDTMPHEPFRLDDTSWRSPSTYELDFVISDRRYHYEFSLDSTGVLHEQLLELSSRQWRTLINRARGVEIRPKSLASKIGLVANRELLLSRALVLKTLPLSRIAHEIILGLDFYLFNEFHRNHRLSEISEALAKGEASLEDVVSILRIADIGISKVDLTEEEMPAEQRKIIRAIKTVMNDTEPENIEQPTQSILKDDDQEFITRSMQFSHGQGLKPFNIHDESSGTIAWLALMMGAIETLRNGGVYCVDELDASLHSHLVETFISLFMNPEINIGHGQLIFTSHNTNILSPMSRVELKKAQVWFTEKDLDGATELFSLADFNEGSDANHEKRYLEGRYGAVPALAPLEIARILQQGPHQKVA